MDDADRLAGPVPVQVIGGVDGLLIIAPANPEKSTDAPLGQLWVCRRGGDLNHPGGGVDVRGRRGHIGATVTDHQGNLVGHQLSSHRLRLVRIAGIVANHQRHPLPQYPAEGIDIRHGLLGAALKLLTRPGTRPGHGPGKADQNVSL